MGVNDSNKAKAASAKPRKEPGSARDKALSPHGHTSRFLYLMLKQVDIKQIDWQVVADSTGINTGNAARARYGRFKKQIESQILGDAIEIKRERQKEETMNIAGTGAEDELPSLSSGQRRIEETNTFAVGERGIKDEDDTSVGEVRRRSSSAIFFESRLTTGSLTPASFVKAESGAYENARFSYVKLETDPDRFTYRDPTTLTGRGEIIKIEEDVPDMPVSSLDCNTLISSAQTQQHMYRSPRAAFTSTDTQMSDLQIAQSSVSRSEATARIGPARTKQTSSQEPIYIDD